MADLLSHSRAELAEIVLEIGVRNRAVRPMKLKARTGREPLGGQSVQLFFAAKEDVDRRGAHLVGELPHACDEPRNDLAAVSRGMNQQPMPRSGRKRNRRHELGIVGNAGRVRALRPGKIPDELVHALVFQVERHRADEPLALSGDHDARLPAGAGSDAARPLQRREKGMFEKGVVVIDQSVPIGG